MNAAGLNTVTTVGTPDDYSDLVSAVQKILTANYAGEVSDLALVYDPAIEAIYQGLVTSTEGQPLVPPSWVQSLKKYRTTKIGTADMLVGDFSQLAIGLRTSLRLQILPAGTVADTDGTSWNAASQLLFHVRAYLRADVGVLRPAFFTHLSGVTTGA